MFNDKKTIFALATPPGKSGVAVIRISGPDALTNLGKFTLDSKLESRKATLRNIIDPTTKLLIDKAIILTFPGPNSFTGEDVVELHIHGSRAVINAIIKLLSEFSNFRPANPGEFAKRAFLNNKMNLTEAEGLSDLIEAETLIQQQQAIRQMQGELANMYNHWKIQLISMLARIEAYLDFPEDDVPNHVVEEVNSMVSSLIKNIKKHLNDEHRGEIIRRGIYVAILGAPNVGKSSLLNYLAKKDVAIVSNIAGTTRDVIEVNLDLDGYPVTIADTAGIRESEDLIEKEGIHRALARAQDADIKIIMLAANDQNSFGEEISSIIDNNSIILVNKIDQCKNHKKIEHSLEISIKDNLGLDNFIDKLSSLIENKFSPSTDPMITRERHRYHLKQCYDALCYFNLEKSLELACEDLRIAARSLGQIIGIIDVETILDEIFSKFCIGK